MIWTPATKEEVAEILVELKRGLDPVVWSEFDKYMIEPKPCKIDRFGNRETAYVVACDAEWVVYFDDIEETFGTAKNVDGLLHEPADYGDLIVALRELEKHRSTGR